MPVFCGPRGLPFGKATLYHNRGDGSFEDPRHGLVTVHDTLVEGYDRPGALIAIAGPMVNL
jgi:hypothetical protein